MYRSTSSSGETEVAGNSGKEADPITGQWVLGMGSGFWVNLGGKQKPNLRTNIL